MFRHEQFRGNPVHCSLDRRSTAIRGRTGVIAPDVLEGFFENEMCKLMSHRETTPFETAIGGVVDGEAVVW
jgi:hypothetical protein